MSKVRAVLFVSVMLCFALVCKKATAEELKMEGTHWGLLSLTSKGEKIKDAETPASVDFTKDGKWTVLHYTGRLEGGTYQVKDGRLSMTAIV